MFPISLISTIDSHIIEGGLDYFGHDSKCCLLWMLTLLSNTTISIGSHPWRSLYIPDHPLRSVIPAGGCWGGWVGGLYQTGFPSNQPNNLFHWQKTDLLFEILEKKNSNPECPKPRTSVKLKPKRPNPEHLNPERLNPECLQPRMSVREIDVDCGMFKYSDDELE